ncbi:hypothetical protein BC834DRAFT_1020150 [Gloeopeniophorella convolvens]|nr:hypothetical protein BC834DRAFT_1020150 [Gloeopeniophorella convolvens]
MACPRRGYALTGKDRPQPLHPAILDSTLTALEHLDRAHHVSLFAPKEHLDRLLLELKKPAPQLECLQLVSDSPAFTLPHPLFGGGSHSLRTVHLHNVLPSRLPGSCIVDFTLIIDEIELAQGFSFEYLVECLGAMSHLVRLVFSLGRTTFGLVHDNQGYRNRERMRLDALTDFAFHGLSDQLEVFVDRVDARSLKNFHVSLRERFMVVVPSLHGFLSRCPKLGPTVGFMKFCDEKVLIDVQPTLVGQGRVFFDLSEEDHDLRMASLANLCNSLTPVLSSVRMLYISSREGYEVSDEWGDADPEIWAVLLSPFRRTTHLHLENIFAVSVKDGLLRASSKQLLPSLCDIQLSFHPDDTLNPSDIVDDFDSLILEREQDGYLIKVYAVVMTSNSWRAMKSVKVEPPNIISAWGL